MSEPTRQIEWDGAEVKAGAATLPLTGGASKQWSERFDGVLALLAQGGARWGEVSLTKKAIKVADLQEGAEDDLRHFLESVVVQVNSAFARERDDDGRAELEDPQAARDRQAADKLRSFAQRAEPSSGE
jgi:hypothetical protein